MSTWKRHGHDRLYVNLPDGRNAAWLDRRTGRLNLLLDEHRDAVLDALAPYLSPPTRPTPRTELRPEDDLARNRPGDGLRRRAAPAPGLWARTAARLLGRELEADSWRVGLEGEEYVGARLDKMARRGWRVLHSIPLPRDVDIDHLLIGPGGAFSVNTKCHRGARVWVGDESVRIGGHSHPYVRKSRAEAHRASTTLTRACGFPVEVHPVLAFVAPESLTVVPSLRDVRVVRERELSTFKRLPEVWTTDKAAAVYAAARDRRNWTNA
ncbi:nuclease-related domain-containing protein [Streptomyces capparidis]